MTMDFFNQSKENLIAQLREKNARLRATPKGTTCVVCDQKCKVYHRPLYGKMAATLIALYWLVAHSGKRFHHLTAFQKGWRAGGYSGGGDFTKLVYWKLIATNGEPAEWTITKKGCDFVENQISVPKRAIIYNDTFLGFNDDEWVTIRDVLGTKFNYEELMSR